MSAILDRLDQAISVTDIARHSREVMDKLKAGQDKFVIMRNNVPEAVLLPVARYELLLNELADLRVDAQARERLNDGGSAERISLEEMTAHFADGE